MDLGNSSSTPQKSEAGGIKMFFRTIGQRYQRLLDVWTPHVCVRWLSTCVLLLCYMARVFVLQGWYIITYAMGIYHLNLFIAFLTPKIDPALHDDLDDGPELPTKVDEEFRPFMRRLPEFKFWLSATKAVLIAMFCTFFEAFNVPVFWPILLLYFITLFAITMNRQLKHMIRYRYFPWTWGKKVYKGREVIPPQQGVPQPNANSQY